MDGADGVPVLPLSAWGGKRIADMSREELVKALDGIWRAYVAVNARTMGGELAPIPPGDYEAAYERLGEWFSEGDATTWP